LSSCRRGSGIDPAADRGGAIGMMAFGIEYQVVERTAGM
jgi:hypothetical protein